MTARRLLLALVLLALSGAPLRAEDQIIDTKPCNFGCRFWRNLSGTAGPSFPGAIDGSPLPDNGPLPAVDEGVERPRVEAITRHRGAVMVETAAERRARLRQKAALDRDIRQLDARGK